MTCLYEGVDGITWLSFPVQDSARRLGLSLLPSLSIWESLRIHCCWTWSLGLNFQKIQSVSSFGFNSPRAGSRHLVCTPECCGAVALSSTYLALSHSPGQVLGV